MTIMLMLSCDHHANANDAAYADGPVTIAPADDGALTIMPSMMMVL
jgi:hypothetical protein